LGVNEPSLDHSMRVRPFAETRLHCLPSMAVMSPIPICWVRVVSIRQQQNPAVFVLTHRVKMLLRRLLAVYIGIGDGIVFSAPPRGYDLRRNLDHQELRFRLEPLYPPGANRMRQPTEARQTKSVLGFCRGSQETPSASARFACLAKSRASTSIACRELPTELIIPLCKRSCVSRPALRPLSVARSRLTRIMDGRILPLHSKEGLPLR